MRPLPLQDYAQTLARMQAFTAARSDTTPDEIWTLQHEPVYTVGRNGKGRPGRTDIPFMLSDRGGDITYHGPGQIILYVLLDLTRQGLGVRRLVETLEEGAIRWLGAHRIPGERRNGAPGVYVGPRKIASLGLRIRHGCSYHGLAINVQMDLTPFSSIVPCALEGVGVTQVADFGTAPPLEEAASSLAQTFLNCLYL
ncbi:MAG TPA: lipoyl(octanoyl) transferase LipB [Acidiferrobacteraceae bacterium]|nr:lipoyl(octanoyl) transferase LipB [Acidiferrobacteraceae bacterium]